MHGNVSLENQTLSDISANTSNIKTAPSLQEYPSGGKRPVRIWFWTGAVLVFLMLVVGGITRLTQSGLSMVDWRPIMGAVPPMNMAEWQEAFNQYKQYPEYQQLNPDMTLSEFKYIFFWEYIHRMLGRFIGLVFLVPFAWFWFRGRFNRSLKRRSLLLLFLGGGQGVMGWIMVKSGLDEVPYVSHYRLAIHLVLAFAVFACCVWFALDLYEKRRTWIRSQRVFRSIKRWIIGIGVLLVLQIIWGAYVAGLEAGYMYNSFPTMGGQWIPQQLHSMQPVLVNYVENPTTVQWGHRILGTLLGLAIIHFWIRLVSWNVNRQTILKTTLLLVLVIVQYVLGVITVLYGVPVVIGVLHQAFAMLLWGAWIYLLHHQTRQLRLRAP